MKFVSLHHHSTYSYLDGYGHPKDHVARAAELGMSALALTEHGNVSSHAKLEIAAREAGIKPIFGVEMYCGKEKTQRKNHLSVWAADEAGYRNLLRVMTWAWKEGFYYEPTVDGPTLKRYNDGLIVASGCTGSLLSTSLIGGKNIDPAAASYERGKRVAGRFRSLLGDRYYLEVQAFPELEDSTCRINPMVEQIGRELRIPLIATADVHYPYPEQSEMQTILHAVRPGNRRTFEDQERSWGYHVKLTHPESDSSLKVRLGHTGLSRRAVGEAIASTGEVAERCTVDLPKATPLRYPIPRGVDRNTFWKDALRGGWRYRGVRGDEYRARLRREVEVIEGKDFIDYFLIVGEMTRWAKDNGIFVGPARGSAAGSLVCYLLRITEVDPMRFPDLVFERFIDTTREDLPDIDLDFDDARRHEVFEHLAEVYGKDQVSQIGTYTTYKSKLSLDDVARVYSIPSWEVEKVKELLIERSSGDLRASATIEDTIEMFPAARAVVDKFPDLMKATKLEGMVKSMGRHAAGALVSSEPLTETVAVYGESVAVDKYDAEYLNLVKIDVLGLNTCGMFAEAAALLGQDIDYVYSIPLDDEPTLRGFQENDVVGVFQFDGKAMRLVNKALRPDNFYEVCVVNALARPGPLHNNAMNDYADIKSGKKKAELRHPLFDAIVSNTQYQVVYQEQILRIVMDIGGFDWTHAAYIRKIISRKIGDQEFNRQGDRFMAGAKERGLPEALAAKIWGMCITAGSYAFNAAHSVSYGMLGFWAMWLKVHHPLVFYTAALRRIPEERHLSLMRDAERHGVLVLPPDPRLSDVTWRMSKKRNAILAGFTSIPGIGEKTAANIVQARTVDGAAWDWEDMIRVKGIGPKTLDNILEWGNGEDPLAIHKFDRMRDEVMEEIESGALARADGSPLPLPTHRTEDVPFGRGADEPVIWMGVCLERNLRDLFEINMAKTGVPLDPNQIRNAHLREWVLLYSTDDGDDIITLRVGRTIYPRFKKAIWSMRLEEDLMLVKGIKKGRNPQRIIDVTDLVVIRP